jgi:hypothetical protein
MMNAKNIIISFWIGALALLAQCVVAHAIPMTTAPEIEPFTLTAQQVDFKVDNYSGTPPVHTNTNTGPKTTSQLLTFNQFNSGLGILTGVSITYTSVYGAQASLVVGGYGADNATDTTTQFYADATLGHELTGGGLISPQSSPQTFSANCSTSKPGSSCNNVAPNNGINFNGTAGLAAPLASFVGLGTFDLTAKLTSALAPRIDPDNGTGFADNNTIDGALNANWSGEVSVVYNYDSPATAVPEPLSLYLLVAGLSGIALSRRRRQ